MLTKSTLISEVKRIFNLTNESVTLFGNKNYLSISIDSESHLGFNLKRLNELGRILGTDQIDMEGYHVTSVGCETCGYGSSGNTTFNIKEITNFPCDMA